MDNHIINFLKYLSLHGVSSKSLKYYKSDLVNFLNWSKDRKVTQNLIQEYISEIRLITPVSTLNRRLSTLRSYGSYMGFKKESKSWQDGILSKFEHRPKFQKLLNQLFFNRPNWYKKYHSYPLANYIHIAILVLFTSLAGYALYDQIFKTTNNSLAFPTALTRPNRYMSFQGRLTDNLGNPKTVATDMVFNLYSVSTGGVSLWNSGTCSITPDSDGIFSTLLGSSCGAEIAATVFSENASIWLGATMGADAEATPRVQIATVAYALNAETLQGYPTGTGTSTIPYINSSGSLVLANASPKIQSTSGTFAVEGLAMTLTTPTASNGVITINPDGVGTLDLTFEGAAAGLSANGFVNATNANITGGALYGGTVASDATGYNFIDLQGGVSPTSKFSVSATGAITTASGLTIGTTSLSETTSPTDSGAYLIGVNDEFANSASTNVQAVLNDLDAAIGSGMTSFTAAGDSGGGQSITNANTLSILGGTNGIDTIDSATDTITLNLDTTEIGTTTFGSGSGITWTFDGSAGTDTSLAFGDNLITLTSATTTLSGNLKVLGNQILNSAGTASVLFSATPTTTSNTLSAGNWLVENTANVGQAALIVNNLKSGDLLTASASGVTKFTVNSSGDVAMTGDLTVSGGNINTGNIAFVVGDATTDGITFQTDGTGNGEYTFSADGIGDADLDWGTGAGQIDVVDLEAGAVNILLETEIDASSELLAIMDDETGTGVLTFATAPTFTTSIQIGSAGVKLSDDGDGALTFLGVGNGSDENLILNLDDVANTGTFTSSTLLDTLNFSTIDLQESGINVLNNNEIDASSELLAIMDDETGTGALVFANTPTLVAPVIGVATGTSLDLGGTTLYASRAITVDTGGVFNIALGSAAGDDFTVDTDKLVVEGDTGNVGIGTSSPFSTIEILKTAAGDTAPATTGTTDPTVVSRLHFGSVGFDTGILNSGAAFIQNRNVTNFATNYNLLLNPNGGNVGIGDTSPDRLLDVKGNVCLDLNADEACTDNTSALSDARLKDNIIDLEGSLEAVKKFRPVRFDWNGEYNTGTAASLGFIAQDIEKIFPELVITDTAGYKNLDYGKLTAVLAGAIQELNSKMLSFSESFTSRTIKTGIISPVADADLIIDLQPDDSQSASKLVIKGGDNKEVASIDATGLLTAYGIQLTADATVSGTLYADKIESTKLKEIEKLLADVENNQTLVSESQNWDINTATESANIKELVNENIYVTGTASITSLFVSDNITAKSINSLEGALNLQSLALNPLEIMAGKIKIDTNGNTIFTANVEIAGDLKINNLIVANNINQQATISESITNGEITTNSTAGTATLPAGLAELKIKNEKLKANSLIYLTPVTSTQNKVLYVKSKDVGIFTIGFNESIDTDVEFNWWIIELESI